jgi:hypothetical protein
MSVSGKGARTKGHNWERKVALELRVIDRFRAAKRGLQYADGVAEPDVAAGRLAIECKIGKATNIKGAVRQAELSCSQGQIPVAVTKDDRREPLITFRFYDFIELMVGIESDAVQDRCSMR